MVSPPLVSLLAWYLLARTLFPFVSTYFISLYLYSMVYPGKMVPYYPCSIFTYLIQFTWYFIIAWVYVQRMGVFAGLFRNHLNSFLKVWKDVCVLSVKHRFWYCFTRDRRIEFQMITNKMQRFTIYLFIYVRRCACFRRGFRPSSGAQNCTYSVRYLSDQYCYLLLAWPGCSILARLAAGCSIGLTSTWRCMCGFELLVMDGKPVWNMYSVLLK